MRMRARRLGALVVLSLFAAVPAGADPDVSVGQDAFVGLRSNEAPHTGALAVAQPRLAVTADAFVGTRWSDAPSAEALSAVASPAAAPGPRSSTCACPCLARAG